MNEFVFVEFLFEIHNTTKGDTLIYELGNDFVPINSGNEWGVSRPYYSVSGRICSETATAIKLSNKFLSDRMRISYIPENLKDQYRNR